MASSWAGVRVMPWGRLLLGLVVSALLCFSVFSVVRQISDGVSGLEAMQAPGLGDADRAALAAPFNDVLAGRDAEVLARLAEGIDTAEAQAQIDHIQTLLPAATGAAPATRLLNWRNTMGTDGNRLIGLAEHTFESHVGRSETVLYRRASSEAWRIASFNINIVPKAEIAPVEFSLAGKPADYLAIVAATFAAPIFMLATFWVALFWKGLRPRWVWLIIVLLGFCTISLNTGTGAIEFTPLSFLVFGASATWSGSAFDPWILSVAPPIGAIAFWLTRLFGKPPARPMADPV